MKKSLFLLIAVLIGTFCLVAQSVAQDPVYGWKLVQTGTELDLNKIHFADSRTGYIAGNNGLIMKSSTGGETWTNHVIPSLSHFWSVFATSPNDVFVGAWDTIYTTHNGGAAWTGIQTPTVNYMINDIQFLNPETGLAMIQTSSCIKTTDGGDSWHFQGGAGAIEDFLGSHFLNENIGYGVGNCALISKTIDGGLTWENYTWNDWVDFSCLNINDVYFTAAEKGFAVADSGYLFKTIDAGANWSKMVISEPEDTLRSIWFVNENTGYIAGSFGKLFKTEDGGDYWFLDYIPTENHLNAVWFLSETLGFAVGDLGTVLKYCDLNASGIDQPESLNGYSVRVYPNPAENLTTLSLRLPVPSTVRLELLELNGQVAALLAETQMPAGPGTITVSLDRIPKGVYLCQIIAGQWHKRIKLVVF